MVWISVAILIILFSAQRFGTDKVGYSFAPIVGIWFLVNAGIGVFNFIKYDPTVIKALNPWYIVQYFQRNGKDAWVSLGGVVLCVTGLLHYIQRTLVFKYCIHFFRSILQIKLADIHVHPDTYMQGLKHCLLMLGIFL